ncbi:MAG: hypothetical protein UU73_C0002G0011 [Candidatus Daviesbacteria bacterium GW2011_GWA1_41_61]|uniref:Uncharacterized protein n=1 Tax=Candidatus Daviesbacteria bacterium GW2011_GWA2_40_9 TaxID=1618424 RepID=A0A0G0U3U5_9BACT|nr:MAG: hypothetical protein UU26_C0008G0022 [Candidatus Daviesbacteria bacterium GW2011_GWC1_40_9]KKR83734.1 MAG: hypothetical protein UU29_C0002G0047 [Candidatus Daviesbacteria bacterium GW2011_GWA2_40_9]KKR93671.1 MAG: hypothetical protein UU44_C0001G0011 [Candidatus Daviesbacteria bacterium GW2011_GWB1_41_15]KKS15137.1 MAG: hypothetical protein UU73_C0002G0011 [Candidatus Daviesbacteria bacterium GW2011_GWA1_41_61]
MRLEDLERTANNYRQAQALALAEQRVKLKAKIQARQSTKESKESKTKKDVTRTQEILKELQVDEALEVIRDEVWKEGKISFGDSELGGSGRGLRLCSDPFPYLTQISRADWGRTQTSGIGLQEANTTLEVLITAPRSPEFSAITLVDIGSFNVKLRKFDTIKGVVKRRGVGFEALWDGVRLNKGRVSVFSMNKDKLPLQAADTKYQLLSMLYSYQATQKELGSLPAQIREWTNSMIDELPATLRENGFVDRYELREWAHSVRETPTLLRVLDRAVIKIFPYVLYQ